MTYPKEEVEEKEQVLDALQSSHGDAKVALVAAKKQQPFLKKKQQLNNPKRWKHLNTHAASD